METFWNFVWCGTEWSTGLSQMVLLLVEEGWQNHLSPLSAGFILIRRVSGPYIACVYLCVYIYISPRGIEGSYLLYPNLNFLGFVCPRQNGLWYSKHVQNPALLEAKGNCVTWSSFRPYICILLLVLSLKSSNLEYYGECQK